ncbi:MAG: type II toxin-antitoxin system VapC family toxin [Treponema sp.]|nr:type II toxin-antitoxin system VapC family toxin [Treponema sp.]
MIYIFDASFIAALIIPDENNLYVKKLYRSIQNEDEKYAPHILWYEIANIFQNLIRRRRYTYERVVQFFPMLTSFNIIADYGTGTDYAQKLLHLCNDYNLSAYDTAYLELADRKNATLCTLDESLHAAAKKHGVAVLD